MLKSNDSITEEVVTTKYDSEEEILGGNERPYFSTCENQNNYISDIYISVASNFVSAVYKWLSIS